MYAVLGSIVQPNAGRLRGAVALVEDLLSPTVQFQSTSLLDSDISMAPDVASLSLTEGIDKDN